MTSYEFIIQLVTTLGSIIGILFKFKSYIANMLNKYDKVQDEKISILSNKLVEISEKVEELKVNSLETNIFVKQSMFLEDLKFAINKKSEDIIRNKDIESNLSTLLLQGRDLTIDFAYKIRTSKIKPTLESIEREISHTFDALKMTCNTYINQTKFVNGCEVTFARYLREKTEINNISKNLIYRIIENHLDEQKFIKIFETFLEQIYNEGIKAFKQFNNI